MTLDVPIGILNRLRPNTPTAPRYGTLDSSRWHKTYQARWVRFP